MRASKSIVAALLGLMLAAFAQQPRPVQQPNSPLTPQVVKFESTTQLVVVNISVKDKDGKPIENLRPSDFTVSEDGKPQQVKIFEYQRLEETPLPALYTPGGCERQAASSSTRSSTKR